MKLGMLVDTVGQ